MTHDPLHIQLRVAYHHRVCTEALPDCVIDLHTCVCVWCTARFLHLVPGLRVKNGWCCGLSLGSELQVQKLLSGIHYFRIHDYVEQLAVVQTLPAFLKAHPKVSTMLRHPEPQSFPSYVLLPEVEVQWSRRKEEQPK